MKNIKIPDVKPKLVYHIIITSEQSVRELDGLMEGKRDMWCDYAQSLLSWEVEQVTLNKV